MVMTLYIFLTIIKPGALYEEVIMNKEKAVKELVETLKVRAEKRLKNGGLREKKSNSDFVEEVEVEEGQEKRALESPNKEEETDFDEDHNTCKKENDEEDEYQKKIKR